MENLKLEQIQYFHARPIDYNKINITDFGLNNFLKITYFWPQK
jgi:hypothetical protein